MSDTYELTIAGLLRKRHQLTGEIAIFRDRLTHAVAALDHLDATIRLLDPDVELSEPDRRPPPMFTGVRGELTRFILDTLRGAEKPMLTTEVAAAVLKTRGGDTADRRAVQDMTKKISHALHKARLRGTVASERSRSGGEMLWWVV